MYRKTKKQWRLNALNLGVFKEIFGLFMIKIQTHGHGHRVPCGTLLKRLFTSLPGGGGTAIYGRYRYVPR